MRVSEPVGAMRSGMSWMSSSSGWARSAVNPTTSRPASIKRAVTDLLSSPPDTQIPIFSPVRSPICIFVLRIVAGVVAGREALPKIWTVRVAAAGAVAAFIRVAIANNRRVQARVGLRSTADRSTRAKPRTGRRGAARTIAGPSAEQNGRGQSSSHRTELLLAKMRLLPLELALERLERLFGLVWIECIRVVDRGQKLCQLTPFERVIRGIVQ